ncbi:tetratricopeptide repeat protein [Luteolibacter sp. Populi]|uniref:tetratricopeptide repeat protein n=1 Tax=Luteolibacter sp. Populi TaxID=3230487 RepID=UPI003465E9CF
MAEDSIETSRPLAEISHGPSAFEAFLDRNTKGMVVAAILLAIAGGAAIVVRGMKEAAQEEAGGAFSKATTVAELQEVVKKYPDSPAAGSASIVLSDKQWEAQDQDGAIATLRDFIAREPEHPGISSAKASLASRLLQQGKTGEAEPLFRELADSPKSRYLAPYALIALGDIAKAGGKLDEAEESYKKVQESYATSPFANLAATHRRLLRFKAPAEIEPPAGTAPAPGAGLSPGGIPSLTTPSVEFPTPGAPTGPMADILTGGNPVPPAPVEEEPKEEPTPPPAVPPVTPPPSEQPAPPPAEQTPPP